MSKKKKETDDIGVEKPEVGDSIYVPSQFYISHGSDDVRGGKATISKVKKSMSGGKMVWFVTVKETGRGHNWSQFLKDDQKKLKKEYGNQVAHPDPDIDTPWLEAGDYYSDGRGNSGIYSGPPQW